MKIDITKITTKAASIWENVKPAVIKGGKTAAGILVAALAKCGLEKLGIDADIFNTTSKNGTGNILYFPTSKNFNPETSKQKVMYSIYKSTINGNSDWAMLIDARKIAEIAKDSGEDSDINFAIDLISEIAGSMRDAFYVNRANDILMQM